MYIALMLDDENYTEPNFKVCRDIEDGFRIFKKWIGGEFDECYENGNRCELGWYTETYYGSEDMGFAVCEVYELNDKPYVLIWWHAYEGVGFSVRQFDTFEEANAVMRAEADNIYVDETDVEACANEPITPDDWSGIVDNGYEWNCWQIIERSEL